MNRTFTAAAAAAAALMTLAAGHAEAASIGECGSYTSDIRGIVEPWEEFTRTFADGAVRVVLIDLAEPAAAAFHLVILHPPADEMEGWGCSVVSDDDGRGFNGISYSAMTSEQGPDGLTLIMPAGSYNGDADTTTPLTLTVTVDVTAGKVTAKAE